MRIPLKKVLIGCFFLLTFLLSIQVYASDNWQIQYYEDKTATMDVSDVLETYKNGGFNLLPSQKLNPGFTSSYFWIAVVRKGYTNEETINPHFIINNPHINRLYWYKLDSGKIMLANETGDYTPFKTRMLDYTFFAYPLSNADSLYLLKIDKRHETLQFDCSIISLEELKKRDVGENLFYGIFSGAIIILLVLSIFVYVSTRDRIYLLFFFHVFTEAIWLLADKGFGTRYFWPDCVYFASRSRMFFALIGIVASLAFAKTFIKLDKIKIVWKSITAIEALAAFSAFIVILPLPFESESWLIYLLAVNSVVLRGIIFIVFPIILFFQWRKGVKEAKIFALSHAPILVLGMFFNFHIAGLVSLPEVIVQFGLAFGYLVTVLILMFGIVFLFNEYKTENILLLSQINQQQKILTQRVLEAQEMERKSIGQAIHDEVSAKLSVSMLHLSAIKTPQNSVAEALESIHGNLNEVRTTLREISHQLMPIDLGKYGLKKSLEGFLNSVAQSKKVKLEFIIEGFEKIEMTNMAFKTFVYRSILEYTNNIIKHSAASHVLIQVLEIGNILTILVEDNGKGFDIDRTSDGHGLSLIKAQVSHYQGSIEIQSKIDCGTTIIMELPIATV